MKNKLVYELTEDDIHQVAEDILERRLLKHEIEVIKLKLGDYINWYDAIEMAIYESNFQENLNNNQNDS